jgi:uncharacterized protein YgiM (DUF1202 family)
LKRGLFFYALMLVVFTGYACAQTTPPASSEEPATASARLNIPAKIRGNRINIRSGPDARSDRLTLLDAETPVTVIGRRGEWTRIQMRDGRAGWLLASFVQEMKVPESSPAQSAGKTPSAPPVASPPSAKPAPAAPSTPTQAAPPAAPSAPTQAAPPAAPSAPTQAARSATELPDSLFAGTRPDPADRPQDSPSSTLGGGLRMLIYLVPVALLIVLSIRGLKAVYPPGGRSASLKQGIIGGFNLFHARQVGGSSIRLIESVPVGGAGLHLVEVRGRLLLVGTTASAVNLLTELKSDRSTTEEEFRTLLAEAAQELEETDAEPTIPFVVGSLDDSLRSARAVIERSAERVRRADRDRQA